MKGKLPLRRWLGCVILEKSTLFPPARRLSIGVYAQGDCGIMSASREIVTVGKPYQFILYFQRPIPGHLCISLDKKCQYRNGALSFKGVTVAVGKSKRFDLFKRDGFICQYCGRRPPETVLELDHIEPVSKGGDDDPLNLITSCYGGFNGLLAYIGGCLKAIWEESLDAEAS